VEIEPQNVEVAENETNAQIDFEDEDTHYLEEKDDPQAQLSIILEKNNITEEEYIKYITFAKSIFGKYTLPKSKFGAFFPNSSFHFKEIDDLKIIDSELFDIEKLEEIRKNEGLTYDNLVLFMTVAIADILNKNSNRIKESYSLLVYYDSLYMNFVRKKDSIEESVINLSLKLNELSSNFNASKQDKNFWKNISLLQDNIRKIENEIENYILSEEEIEKLNKTIKYLNEQINEFNKKLNSQTTNPEPRIVKKEKTKIKSFILFEGNNVTSISEFLPYIVMDLNEKNPRCLIDRQLLNGKNSSEANNHYVKIPELMTDLLIYDNPRSVVSSNSSVERKKDNIIDFIYKDKSKKERTGMYRIRPNTNSNIRFAEQRIVLKKETEIFSQITTIIKKYLPNLDIDQQEDFAIYVNFGAGLKLGDEDLYSVCNNRYSKIGSKILTLFYENGLYSSKRNNKSLRLKEKLTNEELAELEKIIENSIGTYDKLRELDTRYKFDIIDSAREVNVHELQ